MWRKRSPWSCVRPRSLAQPSSSANSPVRAIASRTIIRAASDNVSGSDCPVQTSLLMYFANAGCRCCGMSCQPDREIPVNWRSACSSNSSRLCVALLGWTDCSISHSSEGHSLTLASPQPDATVDASRESGAFFLHIAILRSTMKLWLQLLRRDTGTVCGQCRQLGRAVANPASRGCA